MSSTSMSLETLQFLMQHMDANRRFEIYQRCPSLREFEKAVPLKINSLVLTENRVIVNGMTYQLGIIRKYNVGETPRFITAVNNSGGIPYEVDKYGVRDDLDAFMEPLGHAERDQREEQLRQILELIIQQNEAQLARQRERRPSRNRIDEHSENNIESARSKLFDLHCRRDNIPPDFEHFLQFTKSHTVDKQEENTIQRYKHNKKFSEAMKTMTTILFGGRSSPINVKKLKFDCSMGAIRLPVGLKLKIEQLMFNGATMARLDVLGSILHKSSFPLKKLDIKYWSDDYASKPMVQTAGILRIRMILRDYLQVISAITNPLVHISLMILSEQVLGELVGHWIESQRPVGYGYIFDDCREPRFASEMEDILKRLNGRPVDDETVIIPMSEATQLKVSYGQFPEFAPRSKWAVRFLTEAVEH